MEQIVSELTPCNHCTYTGIKSRAKRDGKQVELKREDGWTVAYVGGKSVASFMELTNYCCC